jgi:hypothetical protein
VGDVVGGPAENGGGGGGGDNVAVGAKWHAGQQWDFVFDVDFADGAPLKKLACNRGENPYEVADRRAAPAPARAAQTLILSAARRANPLSSTT